MENTKKYYLIHCQGKNLVGMSNALSDRFSNLKKSLPNLLQKYSLCSISEFQGKEANSKAHLLLLKIINRQ